MSLSVLLRITNTRSSFFVAYCYVILESKESFIFMFACIQELIFYENCPDYDVLIADFAIGLGIAMMKVVKKKENPGSKAEFL